MRKEIKYEDGRVGVTYQCDICGTDIETTRRSDTDNLHYAIFGVEFLLRLQKHVHGKEYLFHYHEKCFFEAVVGHLTNIQDTLLMEVPK